MRQSRVVLCFLIGRLSKRSTNYQWVLEKKEVTFINIRQCFSLKILWVGKHKNEEYYEMLICRILLFKESIEYIGHASPRSVISGYLCNLIMNYLWVIHFHSFLYWRNKFPCTNQEFTCPIDSNDSSNKWDLLMNILYSSFHGFPFSKHLRGKLFSYINWVTSTFKLMHGYSLDILRHFWQSIY